MFDFVGLAFIREADLIFMIFIGIWAFHWFFKKLRLFLLSESYPIFY
jgi:hypothetical protein